MLLFCPKKHLNKGNSCKQVSTPNLGLHCESYPAETFPEIVRATNEVEAPTFGYAAFSRTFFSEVFKNQMALKVEQLKNGEQACANGKDFVISPRRGLVVWFQKEVHVAHAEEDPIVKAVFEDIGEGHCLTAESMHKKGFKLAFHIVS